MRRPYSRFCYGFQPRPDGSGLHHPPPSLANCGTAETGEIFRAVGGVLSGSGVTRDALEGLNWPHFRYWSLIAIFECHVCAKLGRKDADRAFRRRKRGHPKSPESRPGLLWRSRLARSGPGAAQAWIQVSALGKSGYGASMATNTWPMVFPDPTSLLERSPLDLIPSPRRSGGAPFLFPQDWVRIRGRPRSGSLVLISGDLFDGERRRPQCR